MGGTSGPTATVDEAPTEPTPTVDEDSTSGPTPTADEDGTGAAAGAPGA
jgi:hypothetical protein